MLQEYESETSRISGTDGKANNKSLERDLASDVYRSWIPATISLSVLHASCVKISHAHGFIRRKTVQRNSMLEISESFRLSTICLMRLDSAR